MHLATVDGRSTVLTSRGALDVYEASGGQFGPDPHDVFDRWGEFLAWHDVSGDLLSSASVRSVSPAQLQAPAPSPRQVFAIGLNYHDHATEAAMAAPALEPVVFTKFPSSVSGPSDVVGLPSGAVDFEAELVVVIGRLAHRVPRGQAWSHVAGLTLGQDISDRVVQFRGPSPQFSLGKSYPGFSPIGPVLVTPDEFPDPDDIGLGCRLDGQQMQQSRTSNLIFPIPQLIESISAVVRLLPGDLIFTGTPAGVGWTREPKVLLHPAAELTTHAEVIGEMTTHFTSV